MHVYEDKALFGDLMYERAMFACTTAKCTDLHMGKEVPYLLLIVNKIKQLLIPII